MSWRTLASWELRARMSPELLAGGLSAVVVAVVAGALWLGPWAGTAPNGGDRGADATPSPAASATPVPTPTLDTVSVEPILVLNERLLDTAAEAATALEAMPFSSADAAALLRRLNATVTSARELAGSLGRDQRTSDLGGKLEALYIELRGLADDALRSSLSSSAAYESALAELPTRMARLAALSDELASLLD